MSNQNLILKFKIVITLSIFFTLTVFAGSIDWTCSVSSTSGSNSCALDCSNTANAGASWNCTKITSYDCIRCSNWCHGGTNDPPNFTTLVSGESLNKIQTNDYTCPARSATSAAVTNCDYNQCPPYCCEYEHNSTACKTWCHTSGRCASITVTVPEYVFDFKKIPFEHTPPCTISSGDNLMKGDTTVTCQCVDPYIYNGKCWEEYGNVTHSAPTPFPAGSYDQVGPSTPGANGGTSNLTASYKVNSTDSGSCPP